MIDIVSIGTDIGLFNTDVSRATNILSIQVGSLEYEPDLGIDLSYFLSKDFSFQNEAFKAYLIQVLANRGINVSSLTETIESLQSKYIFNLTSDNTSTSLVAR
jgi:hypothetical protein